MTDSQVPFANRSLADWDRDSWVAPHLDAVLSRVRKTSGKKFRSRLVELSARTVLASRGQTMSQEISDRIVEAGRAVEDIHLGSLVVDDIQDGSSVRRGEPALHRQVGVPLALNAGNWLYFAALKSLMRIPWSSVCECEAVDLAIEAMVLAHEGQAVDLGVDILKVADADLPHAVKASADRKTGALVAAAFGLGFLAAHADGEFDRELYYAFQSFGKDWGVCLQMFDDLGALQQSILGLAPMEKQFEDLRNKRPSYLWTVIAEVLPRQNFVKERTDIENFISELEKESVQQPCAISYARIAGWPSFKSFRETIERHGLVEVGLKSAKLRTDAAIQKLADQIAERGVVSSLIESELSEIGNISTDLSRAYFGGVE